ncbi:calcium/sodium antiporter [Halorussus salilacus]|uniref:calcium/sodium antiporter n=1 Tax=Halorussus salilacus TaxID=2953750 RepID=UPI00209EE8E3|nr:calcium/sodium antiporter [Halorussus salilacus]USZ69294.1 calcium/sodium antiporter [Halorussus salilacus]
MLGVLVDLAVIAGSVLALWYGATAFVEAASLVARRVGLSELVVGLTVVAVGTSTPELLVTLDAAVVGRTGVAVGNVVGSNVFNLGLLVGAVAVFAPVPTGRTLVYQDGVAVVAATLLTTALVADGTLSRVEGVGLLVVYATYVLVLIRRGSGSEAALSADGSAESAASGGTTVSTGESADSPVETVAEAVSPRHLLRGVVGFGLLVGGAHLLVESSADLARLVGVSEWAIGATVVAVGTSTPELATSMAASASGRHEVSIGNLVGSNVFNLLGALGATAAIRPVQVTGDAWTGLLWLCAQMAVVVVLFRTGWRLSRAEGALLAAGTLAWWAASVAG